MHVTYFTKTQLFDAPLSKNELTFDMPDNNDGFLPQVRLSERLALFSTQLIHEAQARQNPRIRRLRLDRSAVGILIKSKSNELLD